MFHAIGMYKLSRYYDIISSKYFNISSEENVYKLVEEVSKMYPNELHKCFVVFISNQSRTVPLWRQKAGKDEDRLVIWVILVNM